MANEQAPHLKAFLDAAQSFIGLKEVGSNSFGNDPRGKDLWNTWGWNASGTAWCAIFVSVCAIKAGVSGIVIGRNETAGVLANLTVDLGGSWVDGPYLNGGNPVYPQPGDLITYATASHHGHGMHGASHIGLVWYVDGDTVHTIEGNASDQCKEVTRNVGYKNINAYVRPDWSKVGDIVDGHLLEEETAAETFVPLYNNYNDRHDMTLRQVCYLNNNYQLSDIGSGIAISTINYTTMLGTIYDAFAPAYASNISIDTSLLSGNTKIAVDYFLSMTYPASSACAMVGCLFAYSKLDPTNNELWAIDKKYHYGIGAWTSNKLGLLEATQGACHLSWDIDLSHQLTYFLTDIYTNFPDLFAHSKTKPLGEDAVNELVDEFITIYNPPYDFEPVRRTAKEFATRTYNNLIIIEGVAIGDTTVLTDIAGNQLHAQYSVDIPPIAQTGIKDYYTSYSKYYYKWASSSLQKKLSRVWSDQGFPCDRGIATIGGYYCVAVMAQKFGGVGNVLRITLENSVTFNAIVADVKGSDASNEWGHVYDGAVSIVEWERVKTDSNGRVIVASSLKGDNVDNSWAVADIWADWWGQKVVNITNYGMYCSLGG